LTLCHRVHFLRRQTKAYRIASRVTAGKVRRSRPWLYSGFLILIHEECATSGRYGAPFHFATIPSRSRAQTRSRRRARTANVAERRVAESSARARFALTADALADLALRALARRRRRKQARRARTSVVGPRLSRSKQTISPSSTAVAASSQSMNSAGFPETGERIGVA